MIRSAPSACITNMSGWPREHVGCYSWAPQAQHTAQTGGSDRHNPGLLGGSRWTCYRASSGLLWGRVKCGSRNTQPAYHLTGLGAGDKHDTVEFPAFPPASARPAAATSSPKWAPGSGSRSSSHCLMPPVCRTLGFRAVSPGPPVCECEDRFRWGLARRSWRRRGSSSREGSCDGDLCKAGGISLSANGQRGIMPLKTKERGS
jgi:hypothetical protein